MDDEGQFAALVTLLRNLAGLGLRVIVSTHPRTQAIPAQGARDLPPPRWRR